MSKLVGDLRIIMQMPIFVDFVNQSNIHKNRFDHNVNVLKHVCSKLVLFVDKEQI